MSDSPPEVESVEKGRIERERTKNMDVKRERGFWIMKGCDHKRTAATLWLVLECLYFYIKSLKSTCCHPCSLHLGSTPVALHYKPWQGQEVLYHCGSLTQCLHITESHIKGSTKCHSPGHRACSGHPFFLCLIPKWKWMNRLYAKRWWRTTLIAWVHIFALL